ncbi:serine/threonine-protein kinase [Streptomyces sp. ERV7]|uniref:serine/threonine-protein kinase n=1 Tax=Streptomyces sp. ERV7 TaxID=1322334 RepID=UPI001F389A5D|nr:serine/threonine-protein kinase [Streptomyces sp. ERV7]
MSDPMRVGPYRIEGRLGSGGMGWVYLGRSPAGRAVAVKVVRPELAADEEFRRRFAREVAAARLVGGAFTAAVVDADPEAELPWLATAYVPGPALSEAVGSDGPLTGGQARRLGAGLVEALQAIHGAGVVHRDLKPSNVLLAADGPRVIDFGISMVAGATGLTRAGTLMGTPPYMSPEQMTGARVGPASDVFSLGGVLVYAVTGYAPFRHGAGVAYRVVHAEPELDDVPAELRPLAEQCLAKRPEDRPGLDALLSGLLGPDAGSARALTWPPPTVAKRIRVRTGELDVRRASGSRASLPSCLLLHAQTLLDAGLSDAMVIEAVGRAAL